MQEWEARPGNEDHTALPAKSGFASAALPGVILLGKMGLWAGTAPNPWYLPSSEITLQSALSKDPDGQGGAPEASVKNFPYQASPRAIGDFPREAMHVSKEFYYLNSLTTHFLIPGFMGSKAVLEESKGKIPLKTSIS